MVSREPLTELAGGGGGRAVQPHQEERGWYQVPPHSCLKGIVHHIA